MIARSSSRKFGWCVDLVSDNAPEESEFRVAAESMVGHTGRLVTDHEIDSEGRGTSFRAGDLLFSKLRPYLAKSWVANRDGEALGDIHVYRPVDEMSSRYLGYLLLSSFFLEQVNASTYGTKMPRANWDFIKTIEVWAPDFDTQRRIADYLDRETTTIDVVIEKQRGLISLLNTRREGVLLEASGIDAPWPRMPIKRVLRKVFVRSDEPVGPVVTAFRDGQVIARNDRRSGGYTESEAHAGYQEVGVGDFVYHGLDGFAGAVGISESDGICSPVYHVCRAQRADVHLPFFAYQLRALGIAGFLEAFSWSVRQRSVDYRNWPTFSALEIACPPHEEQKRIARRIVSETAKIDALIAKAERFIELAKERRAALITAAVTGQIEIPRED